MLAISRWLVWFTAAVARIPNAGGMYSGEIESLHRDPGIATLDPECDFPGINIPSFHCNCSSLPVLHMKWCEVRLCLAACCVIQYGT